MLRYSPRNNIHRTKTGQKGPICRHGALFILNDPTWMNASLIELSITLFVEYDRSLYELQRFCKRHFPLLQNIVRWPWPVAGMNSKNIWLGYCFIWMNYWTKHNALLWIHDVDVLLQNKQFPPQSFFQVLVLFFPNRICTHFTLCWRK